MTDRLCPWDSRPLPPDPRAVYCRQACRQAVYRAGGPAAAAARKEAAAERWARTSRWMNSRAPEIAKQLRDEARRLRELADRRGGSE